MKSDSYPLLKKVTRWLRIEKTWDAGWIAAMQRSMGGNTLVLDLELDRSGMGILHASMQPCIATWAQEDQQVTGFHFHSTIVAGGDLPRVLLFAGMDL